MKKLITLLLLSPLAFAQTEKSENFEFSLSCKVLDQIIFKVEDGKSTRWSNYADEVKVGDNFLIEFKFRSLVGS